MVAKIGFFDCTDVDSVIVPRDANRGRLKIQLRGNQAIALAFGQVAKFSDGIRIMHDGDIFSMCSPQSTEDVHAICDTHKTASGGWQAD